MLIWLNGQFVPLQDANVSAFDAGFQHGVGLFETMQARNGGVFRVDAHLNRLRTSAIELRLVENLNIQPLADAVELTLRKNELREARLRLTLTGGDLNLLAAARASRGRQAAQRAMAHEPTILIHAQPPQQYPEAFFEKGVTITIANARLNPLDTLGGHKTLNYWSRLRALQDAALLGGAEALWFSVSNHLAGGSVSNIFLVKDSALFTPIARGEEREIGGASGIDGTALPSPVLPGITRDTVLSICEEHDLHFARRMLDINDVLTADEVFLTNSSWGVLPVVHVEREKIGDGEVGETTRLIRRNWLSRLNAGVE